MAPFSALTLAGTMPTMATGTSSGLTRKFTRTRTMSLPQGRGSSCLAHHRAEDLAAVGLVASIAGDVDRLGGGWTGAMGGSFKTMVAPEAQAHPED
jgi:hypothetical protein